MKVTWKASLKATATFTYCNDCYLWRAAAASGVMWREAGVPYASTQATCERSLS